MSIEGLAWVISVEHGGNDVPDQYRAHFEGLDALLASHRGWDRGALALGDALHVRLGGALIASTTTRLLVDLNRSRHHPRVFSDASRRLPRPERARILDEYHEPHRSAVEHAVSTAVAEGHVAVHLGVHTFTPVLGGKERGMDVGLLYDPKRATETAFVNRWIAAMGRAAPERVFRRNAPYKGYSDGLTTTLRQRYPDAAYLGIEIEVNQRHLTRDGTFPPWVATLLADTLLATATPPVTTTPTDAS